MGGAQAVLLSGALALLLHIGLDVALDDAARPARCLPPGAGRCPARPPCAARPARPASRPSSAAEHLGWLEPAAELLAPSPQPSCSLRPLRLFGPQPWPSRPAPPGRPVSPASPITAIGVPIGTLSPACTRISSSTPARNAGTSTLALSVSTTAIVSPWATASPAFFNPLAQLALRPCQSPVWAW